MVYNISYNLGPRPSVPRLNVYQIFYDDKTRAGLDRGFIPLDNSSNARPDWFEFWVILNFLRANRLEEDAWYGFLSPKFHYKTGLDSKAVFELLNEIDRAHDVALFSPGMDQIIYFKNIFEQGEFWHPGLINLTQQFIREAGIQIDINEMNSHSHNSCFSNYIVAKASYWRKWLHLAEVLFALAEDPKSETGQALSSATTYNTTSEPMKTFVQERLSSLILADSSFQVFSLPLSFSLRHYLPKTRELLTAIDVLKRDLSPKTAEIYRPTLAALLATLRFDKPSRGVKPIANQT